MTALRPTTMPDSSSLFDQQVNARRCGTKRTRANRHFVMAMALVALVLGAAPLIAASLLWAPALNQTSVMAGHGRVGSLMPGPWGHVRYRQITIAPPLANVPLVPTFRGTTWTFPETSHHEFADLLATLGLASKMFTELLDQTHAAPDIEGFVVQPGPELAGALSQESRKLLYNRLAQSPANRQAINAFRYWGTSVAEWLQDAQISTSTLSAVQTLTYRQDGLLFFADLPLVQGQIVDESERRRLVQALARENTLLLTLQVHEGQDVEPLVTYWGRGGRAKDVRPLLKSLAGTPGGGTIGIIHLLPPFAKSHLYTYPNNAKTLPSGDSRDCHWTALNFFSQEPDDRYANAEVVAHTLAETYEPVRQPQLGDLVVFLSDGRIFHTAVYIADDVLFTKNGPRPSRPWMLLPLNVMRSFYPQTDTVTVKYLRSREHMDAAH